MRLIVMLILLSITATCYAADPLESLNPVEDTLAAMEQTLDALAWDYQDDDALNTDRFVEDIYFVSYDSVAPGGWTKAWPCTLESAASFLIPDFIDCKQPEGESGAGKSRLWKSRLPLSMDLQPGVLVFAQDLDNGGGWFLTKITAVSDVVNGYVEVAAPFRAQVKGLMVAEE
jgi:hypothetical protein